MLEAYAMALRARDCLALVLTPRLEVWASFRFNGRSVLALVHLLQWAGRPSI